MAYDENGNEIPNPNQPVKPPRDRRSVFEAENVNATKAGRWSDQFKQQFNQEFGEGAFDQEFFDKNERLKQERAYEADAPRRAQQEMAEQFEKQAPQMAERAFEGVAGQERRRLAGELSGIKSGASKRGLLYSGMRQGAEAGARGGSEGALASQKQNINQSINQAVQQYKQAPIATGLGIADYQNNLANQAMSMAIENMQERQRGMASAGSAIGGAIGRLVAPKEK